MTAGAVAAVPAALSSVRVRLKSAYWTFCQVLAMTGDEDEAVIDARVQTL